MGVITFNGVASNTLGIEVVHPPHFHYAERNYSYFEIPGGNGSKVIDSGGRKNVDAEYELNFIVGDSFANFEEHAAAIMAWLNSGSGYCKLEDSYNPNWYRMACYSESNQIENVLNGGGKVTVRFTCKPERWLKVGETTSSVTNGQVITNPTHNPAYPLLYVCNSQAGSLTIGDNTILISKSTTNRVAQIGDIATYGENQFIFDGDKWWSYIAPQNPTAYAVSVGDEAYYNNNVIDDPRMFVYSGTENGWVVASDYSGTINFVGKTNTILAAGSDMTTIVLNNKDVGLTTTALVADSTAQTIILGNYIVKSGNYVIYNGSGFVYDGSKWVAVAAYTGEKEFKGLTSTSIAVNSTITLIGLDGMFIDCNSGDAYLDGGQINQNGLISCVEFPFLTSGSNTIEYTDLTNVQLTPRWYI